MRGTLKLMSLKLNGAPAQEDAWNCNDMSLKPIGMLAGEDA